MTILLEGIELILAIIGGISIIKIVANLIKKKPQEDICNGDYFIGLVAFTGKAGQKKVDIIVNLYMKELKNGKSIRDFAYIGDNRYNESFLKHTSEGMEITAWKMGGAFPRTFQPINPLGEMLNRMMKAKFTGTDITVKVEKPDA